MSAKTSGADTGDARSYTPEQQAAVVRIRKCTATAYYDILGIESVRATVTEVDIKRAYRKQSLLTHPDKNGHPHADEAFKMVSNAFGVLGDKEKKEKFDKYGIDPDSRFASQQAANADAWARARQFGGAGGGGGRGGRNMWEDELTPEEMFQRFFAGAGFGGGLGGFDMGNGFVFNMGGGPGVRVHQFGGPRPRARPREATEGGQQQSLITTIITLLPVIVFFLVPLLSSLFAPSTNLPNAPRMVFDNPSVPYTEGRTTEQFNIRYFVNPKDVVGMDSGKLAMLDRQAEQTLLRHLDRECAGEQLVQDKMRQDAQGFFTVDREKLRKAEAFPKPSCDRLKKLGVLS